MEQNELKWLKYLESDGFQKIAKYRLDSEEREKQESLLVALRQKQAQELERMGLPVYARQVPPPPSGAVMLTTADIVAPIVTLKKSDNVTMVETPMLKHDYGEDAMKYGRVMSFRAVDDVEKYLKKRKSYGKFINRLVLEHIKNEESKNAKLQ